MKKSESLLSCCFLSLIISDSIQAYLACLTETAHHQADHPHTAFSPPAPQHISRHTAITTNMINGYVKNPLPEAIKQLPLGLHSAQSQLCCVATSDSPNTRKTQCTIEHLKSHLITAGTDLAALDSALSRQMPVTMPV